MSRTIKIFIERMGLPIPVGCIKGTGPEDASFAYLPEYLSAPGAIPICLALPLREQPFDASATRSYFDGLLPEGFTRRCVAQAVHADEMDYLTILSALGQECIGAITALEGQQAAAPHYRPMAAGDLKAFAEEGASESAQIVVESRVSLAGASGKIGLLLAQDGRWMLPLGTAPSTHIVKQGHVRYSNMVVNELLCLRTAQKCGLAVAHAFVIPEEEPLFASQRFDRVLGPGCRQVDGVPMPYRLHQQDFGQALGIAALQKYEPAGGRYLKRCGDLIRQKSSNPFEDLAAFWDQLMFSLLVGNLDNHVKNFALVYDEAWETLRLSAGYDIVSTCIYANTSFTLPMSLGGVRDVRNLAREDIAAAALEFGLGRAFGLQRFDDLAGVFVRSLQESALELQEQGLEAAGHVAASILEQRRSRLY